MAGDKEVPASQVFQGEEETTRRSKKKGTRDPSRDPSVPRTLTSELEPRLMRVECTVADMHDDITQLSDSVEGLEGKVEAAHTATQYLRDETLGLVNSALATIREEVAKLKEELLGQLRDIRAEVESVKEDVILCDQEEDEASHPKARYADHGKDKAKSKWESKGDNRDGGKPSKPFKCFLCEGSHLARNCPMRQKLSAMIATEEESAPTTRMGAMVMNEDAQLANMRLLNTSRVEDDDLKGRASSTSSTTNIKQGGSLMIVNGEVNEVPTRLLVDTGASHNFLAKEEAKALGVKFTKVDGEMKAINSEATPVYGRAWGVPIRLGKWKGKVDFLVVDIDDEDVVLGMEFLHKVLPFRVSDGMITITSKGSEIGIKLAQLKERDVRVSTLKAWWSPRQRCQGAIHGRIKATKMLGTRHHGVPRDGTTRLKCGVNRTDGAAAHRSIQGTSGALDRVAGTESYMPYFNTSYKPQLDNYTQPNSSECRELFNMMNEFIVYQHEEINELMHDCQQISKSIELLVVQQYTNQQVIHDDNDIGFEDCEESANLTHDIYSPSNESTIEENNFPSIYDSDGENFWSDDIGVVEKEEQPIIVKSLVEKPMVLDLLVVEDFVDKLIHEDEVEGKNIYVKPNPSPLNIPFSQRLDLVPSFTMSNPLYFLKMSPFHDTLGHVDLDDYSKRCLETYLTCMCTDKPQEWARWLPLAEFWYNTTFHSAIQATPYEILYGQAPPFHVPYLKGVGMIGSVDRSLHQREVALAMIKENLLKAQNRMKQQADKHRKDASWEDIEAIEAQFPDFNPRGFSQGEGIDANINQLEGNLVTVPLVLAEIKLKLGNAELKDELEGA
uniref:Uncharacterized protein n=1 Tax=Chenopodium quinoa TaxID=63459 RepID=A0A803N8F2_CHEQI